MVGLAGNLHSLLGNVAKDANGDARAGKGVAVYEGLVDTELATDCLLILVSMKTWMLRCWM